jgi:hypothetical protein
VAVRGRWQSLVSGKKLEQSAMVPMANDERPTTNDLFLTNDEA